MSDNTKKELSVEVPLAFDAKTNTIRAIMHGLQKGVEHLFNSYGDHVSKQPPKVVVEVPSVVVESKTIQPETVYEDTKSDAIEE